MKDRNNDSPPNRRTLKDDVRSGFAMDLWSGLLNVVAVVSVSWMVKRLLSILGPEAYETAGGNFKIVGIMLLGTVAAGLFVVLGEYLFISKAIQEVKDEERNAMFWPTLTVMLLCACGLLAILVRAFLLWFGLINSGSPPPVQLEWMFRFVEWLRA